MNGPAVKISDSAHAMTLTAYFLCAVSGMLFQSGAASASILEQVWPHALYIAWATAMLVAGAACFIAAILIPRRVNPAPTLMIEFVGCMILAATFGAYEWSLAVRGTDFALTTQTLSVAIALGCLGRAAQVIVDILRVRGAFKATPGN